MYGILNAKEEIFITDWWLCPEIYLKRPAQNRLDYRLDELLIKKAKEGVKIYVLLFKEVKFAIGLVSGRVKRVLTQNTPNILVLRHPLNSNTNPLKMVSEMRFICYLLFIVIYCYLFVIYTDHVVSS